MKTHLIENFCISLGYFDIQAKIPLKSLLFTIGKLYSLLFVVYFDPSYTDFDSRTHNFRNNYEVLIPFQIELMDYMLNINIFKNYIILISNILIILAIFLINLNHCYFTDKESIEEKMKKNHIFNKFMQAIATKLAILNSAFIQPVLIFGLYSLKYSTVNQEYFWIINNIFFLSFLHIQAIIDFVTTQGALIIQQKQYKKLQISFFEYSQFFLLHIQPYILIFVNKNSAIYLQSTIYLFITLLEGISIFLSKIYLNQKQTLISIAIHSFGSYICVCNFARLNKQLILVILLAIFKVKIVKQLYDEYIISIYLKDIEQLDFSEIHYMICQIIAEEKLQNQKLCIINAIKLNEHQLICSNVKCNCKKQNNYSSDSQQFLFLPDFCQTEFRNCLSARIKKILQKLEMSDYFYFFCHFFFALNLFGEVQEIYSIIENQKIVDQLSQIQKIKWKIFIIIMKQHLFNNFTAKIENYSRDQIALSIKINEFVQSEGFNKNIKEGMINIIQQKIDYQTKLFQKMAGVKLLNQYYQLIINIEQQEKILQMIYDKFPSQKNQSQLMFYFAEIKYDWQKAYDKLQVNAIDNQLLNQNTDIDVNQLANKMAYLTFSFENKNLAIQSFSKKAPHIFGYQPKFFELIQMADTLIPKPIRDFHPNFIEGFLMDGKGHFFRKKSQNICLQKNGLLQNINFFYDLYFDSNQCFRFIGFFCLQEQIEPTILIDKENKIQGINKELFKKLNFNPQIFESIDLEEQFYSLPAQYFIPESILNGEETSQTFSFSFPKEQIFSQIVKSNNLMIKQQLLKKEKNNLTFDVNFEIFIRENYKILKFKKMSETFQIKHLFSLEALSCIEIPIQICQEETIVYPYEDNKSSVELPLTINIILDTQRKRDQKEKILSDGGDDRNKISKFSQRQIQYDYSEEDISNIEEKTIQILGNVYQEIHINNDNFAGGSQASSIAGLRKSKFFRKYSLLNQLNDSKIKSPLVLKIFALLSLALITQTIYLNTLYSKQDFNDLNYYYESVQINHYFIEPMQKFFLTRYMLQDYQFTSYSQAISSQKLAYYMNFIIPLLVDTYEQFKINFQDHFQDETLSKFIEDKYVMIKQQTTHYSPILLQEFNITLFNSFSILLDAFYKQQQVYVSSKTTKGTNPHNTFQYVNYIFFVTIFDEISDQIFEESIIQIDLVTQRWITLLIPTTIPVVLFVLAYGYYFNYFNHVIEKFFALSFYVEPSSIQNDLLRQQFILQKLKQGSDIIHKYKFNLLAKEDLLKIKDQRQRKEKQGVLLENTQSYFSLRVSRFPLFTCLFILFLQYSLIAGPMTYFGVNVFQSFPDTISFFKAFSDIGVYVPAAFSQKEIIYFFSYFTYFTSNDRVLFVDQIKKAATKIDNFLDLAIDQENLQFSSEFINQFVYVERNNLCALLNSSRYYDFDYFCKNSYNGILKLGLIPTLNTFNNYLKNEIAINFPANRALPPQEELEAVYLCSDVISEITFQMEQDIKKQTQQIENMYDILNGITLTFTIILILSIYQIVFKTFELKLHRTMMISLTFPLETILINDHFERELRRIATNENLI